MKGILIKGVNQVIGLSASDYYGAGFEVSVFDQNQNAYVLKDLPMKENVEPVDDFSTKLVADAPKGSSILQVDSIDGLNKSDRISIGGEIYRVTDITSKDTDSDGNADEFFVKLHRETPADLATDTELTRVGNLGLFYINLFLTREGTFVLTAKDTKFGLQHSESVEVKAKDIETMISEVNEEVDKGINVVKTNTGWSVIV